jgi:preprotein translocase subunit SecD
MVRGLTSRQAQYTSTCKGDEQKRDRYYDDTDEPGPGFSVAKGDALPTADQIAELRKLVSFEKPREDVGKIVLKFNGDDGAAKLDEAFLKRFSQELSLVRSTDRKVATFHIKKEVEETIRNSAVAQAKDKILRRVDSLGLKEATISTRGGRLEQRRPPRACYGPARWLS